MKILYITRLTVLYCFFYSFTINACTQVQGIGPLINNIDFGNITLNRDVPVGSVIGRVEIAPSMQTIAFCRVNPFYSGMEMMLPPSSNPGIYETGVKGVGIRGGTKGSNKMYSSPIFEWARYDAPTSIQDSAYDFFELIKIGDITPGNIQSKNIAKYQLRSSQGTIAAIQIRINQTPIQVRTCRVLSTSVTVDLGSAKLRENFNGIGSTSNHKEFSIPLDCDDKTPINITLNNVSPLADRANGVLDVNQTSTAKGIGVQVNHKNSPIQFGRVINYGMSTGGNINIPFEARFYQTENNVQPGTVNATATFTMTYR